jgi:nitrogen fixation/metabolism regulation signal transduction histidine kinase
VTRRVARLHQAARAVGSGDLSVRVAPKGKDELDELGRAFDRMVAELGQARSRLEYLQKVSAWQEVARRLAHEIKNPLMPIQLAVQEIASKYSGNDPAYRRLLDTATEILREEITGLRRLVEDFSAFAKLPKVEPTPLDLVPLVEEIVRLQPEWQSLVKVQTSTPVFAPCDKLLFRRVIANLVENALQAARAAGREPQVVIRVERRPERERAAILVDDNGPGVPEAERQRVFDPYVTFRPGGTGLGLAIVRKIVIDHGGDVSAGEAPAPLHGARFVVELPYRLRSVDDSRQGQSASWRSHAGARAIALGEQLANRGILHLAVAHGYQGTHQDAHHVFEKGRPLHLAGDQGAVAANIDASEQPHGGLALAVGGAESAEVVLAAQERRSPAHRVHVERDEHVPTIARTAG